MDMQPRTGHGDAPQGEVAATDTIHCVFDPVEKSGPSSFRVETNIHNSWS
jgi:hypothetical protein